MDYKPTTREERYGKGWMGDKNYKDTVIQRYREQQKRKSEVVITNIQDIMRIDEDYRKKMYTGELLHDEWTHEDLRVLFGDYLGRCHYEDDNWSLESGDQPWKWDIDRNEIVQTWKGHDGSVWGMLITSFALITGGLDGMVKLWVSFFFTVQDSIL